MSIEAIAALSAAAAEPLAALPGVTAPAGTEFRTALASLEHLNGQMLANDNVMQQLALGQTDNLHQVMIGLERTRLEFDLMLQVRNKALEAYQELMRMQV
jgi:flagellar hook-basal body complex protein FliE